LPSNSTQVPQISVILSDTNATYTIEPNSTLPGSTKINVVAENAKTTKTYTIDFVLYGDISDPTLSSITVNGRPINHFNSLRKNYVFNLGDESSRPDVSATASSADASITYFESNDYTYIKSISSDHQDSAIYSVFFRPQNLIWWDDFSSSSLNLNNWSYELGNGCNQGENLCGWGNQELQSYSEENISIEQIPGEEGNNALVITAMEQGSTDFTSGRITSQDNVHFQYGIVEIRMKVPEVETGLWPAAWFLGGNHPEVGWPKSGEIDLMEMGQKKSFRTQQGYPNSSANQYVGSNIIWYSSAACVTGNETCAAAIASDVNYNNPYVSSDNLNERFQVYRLYWSKDHIRLTVQDQGNEHSLYTAPFGTTSNELRDAFNQDFFMILNLAVGGNFTDALNASQITASLPAKMYIDYIRLYQYNGEGSVLIDGEMLTSNEQIFEEYDYPKSFKLFQNYPNPFNPVTSIEFKLQKTSNVQIIISDVLGRLISDQKLGNLGAGRHNYQFDASDLSSGLYFYSLSVNGQLMDTKKMILLK
jgi:beta-glucanase (GH16 family)